MDSRPRIDESELKHSLMKGLEEIAQSERVPHIERTQARFLSYRLRRNPVDILDMRIAEDYLQRVNIYG